MIGFILGMAVGAAGMWAYRFWKGNDDTSWDQGFSTSGSGTNTYSNYSSQPAGSATTSGTTSGETSSTPSTSS